MTGAAMDAFVDLTLLPDPEFPATTLMNALFSKLHRGLVGPEIELSQLALQSDLHYPTPVRALVDAAFIVGPAAHGNRLLPSLYFTPRPVDQLLVI